MDYAVLFHDCNQSALTYLYKLHQPSTTLMGKDVNLFVNGGSITGDKMEH